VAGAAGSLLWMPRDEALARLEEAGQRLQVLDQDNYYTYMTRSFQAFLQADWDTKLQTHREMVKRFPSHPYTHMGHALALAALGQFEQCIESARLATRLGPRDYSAAVYIHIAATCEFMRGEYAQAAQLARTAYGMNPSLPSPPVLLAAALALDGRPDEARAAVAEYLQHTPGYRAEHLGRFLRGRDARYLEGRDRAIAALRTVGMP
jgi:tetratricopeptide (TPR) repeat protein